MSSLWCYRLTVTCRFIVCWWWLIIRFIEFPKCCWIAEAWNSTIYIKLYYCFVINLQLNMQTVQPLWVNCEDTQIIITTIACLREQNNYFTLDYFIWRIFGRFSSSAKITHLQPYNPPSSRPKFACCWVVHAHDMSWVIAFRKVWFYQKLSGTINCRNMLSNISLWKHSHNIVCITVLTYLVKGIWFILKYNDIRDKNDLLSE